MSPVPLPESFRGGCSFGAAQHAWVLAVSPDDMSTQCRMKNHNSVCQKSFYQRDPISSASGNIVVIEIVAWVVHHARTK
jgi:hypothetical protein